MEFLNDEKERFDSANEYLSGLDGVIVSSGSKRISEIRTESRKQGFDVIIIDYLQLVKPDRTYGSINSAHKAFMNLLAYSSCSGRILLMSDHPLRPVSAVQPLGWIVGCLRRLVLGC